MRFRDDGTTPTVGGYVKDKTCPACHHKRLRLYESHGYTVPWYLCSTAKCHWLGRAVEDRYPSAAYGEKDSA